MVQVFEDPSGLNYETYYSYNTLDDVLSITEKGGTTNTSLWRTRTFTYDFPVAITERQQPGVWNNYLQLRRERKCIEQGCASTESDKLNHGHHELLIRFIELDNAKKVTATAPRQPSNLAMTALLFRDVPLHRPLYLTVTQKASALPCATALVQLHGKHDQVGRVLTESRTIVGTSAWTKAAGYTYNLDGSIATISNTGVGRVMTYTPTGAGRMKSVVEHRWEHQFCNECHIHASWRGGDLYQWRHH